MVDLGRTGQGRVTVTETHLVLTPRVRDSSPLRVVYTVQHLSTCILTNTWCALGRHALLNWGKTWSKVVIALGAYAPRISDSQQGSETEYHRAYHDLEQVAVRTNLRTPSRNRDQMRAGAV
jgi:hypothetical protein